eukprot:s851_g14.t1
MTLSWDEAESSLWQSCPARMCSNWPTCTLPAPNWAPCFLWDPTCANLLQSVPVSGHEFNGHHCEDLTNLIFAVLRLAAMGNVANYRSPWCEPCHSHPFSSGLHILAKVERISQ